MRILPLLLLLLALPVSADKRSVLAARNKPVGGAVCATSDTAIAHDELLEGFQTATTGYENTWAEVGTTANINHAADSSALTSGKPAGACNQAWKVTVPSDGTETYAKWLIGTPITLGSANIDLVFYIYLDGDPSNLKTLYPLTVEGGFGDLNGALGIFNSTGTIECRWESQGTSSSFDTGWSKNTWHKISVHFDTTAASSTFQLDANTPLSFTWSSGLFHNTFTQLDIGPARLLNAGDADGVNVWIDLVCLNTP